MVTKKEVEELLSLSPDSAAAKYQQMEIMLLSSILDELKSLRKDIGSKEEIILSSDETLLIESSKSKPKKKSKKNKKGKK